MLDLRHLPRLTAALLALAVCGCASMRGEPKEPRTTAPDKTKKGAAIGAASGAVGAVILGKREADEILAGAAIGAGIGAGVGAYMDHQEEKLARIPGTTVERVGEDTLLVHFDSDVLFDVDSAILDEAARGSLEQAGAVFQEYPKTAIVVQGHTDATGSEEYNEQLSERRAHSVESFLVGRGIEAGRLTAIGYGEGYPVADNGTESGRRANRRVDLLLKAKAK
jgi:outer membrane protein OmpA-like peptidoglycan-associated protein